MYSIKKHGTSVRIFNTLAFNEDLTGRVGAFLSGTWLLFRWSIKILLAGFITGPDFWTRMWGEDKHATAIDHMPEEEEGGGVLFVVSGSVPGSARTW
jgi:hypothetical protein